MSDWLPHVTVATVAEREGRFLLVEEHVAGQLVLNQPAGHWEQDETLVQAAVRETLEETGWRVQPQALLGVYTYHPPELDYGFVRFAFAAQPLSDETGGPQDPAIARALWLTRDEIAARHASHRSPMVLRCVDDYCDGRRLPLEMVAHLGHRG